MHIYQVVIIIPDLHVQVLLSMHSKRNQETSRFIDQSTKKTLKNKRRKQVMFQQNKLTVLQVLAVKIGNTFSEIPKRKKKQTSHNSWQREAKFY